MERNGNAEITNKMHCQIYGLQYQTVNYLLSFFCSGISLLIPVHDLYSHDVFLWNYNIG
jgi:hypothetical protein